jgi:hypothetical protein
VANPVVANQNTEQQRTGRALWAIMVECSFQTFYFNCPARECQLTLGSVCDFFAADFADSRAIFQLRKL